MVSKRLSKKGIRSTEFREQLLNIFESNNAAIDMMSIEKELKEFDRITLYRTIKTFLEKGILHEINIGGSKKYALCASECEEHHHHHNHVHFHCKKCNDTSCIEADEQLKLNLPEYRIHDIEIQLTGICPKCK